MILYICRYIRTISSYNTNYSCLCTCMYVCVYVQTFWGGKATTHSAQAATTQMQFVEFRFEVF